MTPCSLCVRISEVLVAPSQLLPWQVQDMEKAGASLPKTCQMGTGEKFGDYTKRMLKDLGGRVAELSSKP